MNTGARTKALKVLILNQRLFNRSNHINLLVERASGATGFEHLLPIFNWGTGFEHLYPFLILQHSQEGPI